MAEIPDAFLIHRASVQSFTGTTSAGDTHGAARVDMHCFREAGSKLIRNNVGEEKAINATFYTLLSEDLHERDLITWDAIQSRVVSVLRHTDEGLGAWQHLEVLCE